MIMSATARTFEAASVEVAYAVDRVGEPIVLVEFRADTRQDRMLDVRTIPRKSDIESKYCVEMTTLNTDIHGLDADTSWAYQPK